MISLFKRRSHTDHRLPWHTCESMIAMCLLKVLPLVCFHILQCALYFPILHETARSKGNGQCLSIFAIADKAFSSKKDANLAVIGDTVTPTRMLQTCHKPHFRESEACDWLGIWDDLEGYRLTRNLTILRATSAMPAAPHLDSTQNVHLQARVRSGAGI